jgi:hypothetical protein
MHREHTVRAETGIDRLDGSHAANQQAGSGQQHHRQRQLGDRQDGWCPLAAVAFQALTRVARGRAPGRYHAEKDSGHRRQPERPCEYGGIDRRFGQSWDIRRAKSDERTDACGRQRHAERTRKQ